MTATTPHPRNRFVRRIVTGAAFIGVAAGQLGCLGASTPDGVLTAKVHPPTKPAPAPGRNALGLAQGRDGLIYVPSGYRPDRPATLVVLFHGAGQTAGYMMDRFESLAEEFNLVIVAPDSRGGTWDVVRGQFGPDVAFIDKALNWTFDRVSIDPAHVVAAGFSDGATYALSLGLTNGDFFRRLIAFSPGFYVVNAAHGKPSVFISHGTADQILPIESTSRRIVLELENAGYQVEFREFSGPHTIPPEIAREAVRWLER